MISYTFSCVVCMCVSCRTRVDDAYPMRILPAYHTPFPRHTRLSCARVDCRHVAAALDTLLDADFASLTTLAEPHRLAWRNLETIHLPFPSSCLIAFTTIQRGNVGGLVGVVTLGRPELVELVAPPEDNIRAPVGVVLRAPTRGCDVGEVVQNSACVGAAHREACEPDGHDLVRLLVVFGQIGECANLGRPR